LIGELKAVSELAAEHRAQVTNYLEATRLRLGLLVNFGGAPKARIERLAL
jgi:GxxExxY protein